MKLNFKIDKLTNSIENAISEEIFQTELLPVKDFKNIIFGDWVFDWKAEISDNSRMVFKLTTINNPSVIHGLISLTDKGDHIFMDLIENAKFNKGKKKLYRGVAGNMVAFSANCPSKKNMMA